MTPQRRRAYARAWMCAIVVAVATAGALTGRAESQVGAWHVVDGWPKLPAGKKVGNVSGVAVDAQDNVYVFSQDSEGRLGGPAAAGDIWKFNKAGEFLGNFQEKAAVMANALRVDRAGNVWVADRGVNQIKKFGPDGKLLLTVGQHAIPGDTPDTFDEPTDVAVTPNGEFFVTDGYRNHRVVKFGKDGKYVKEWGTLGKAPGQFRIPHAIVQDARGRLQVVDRCGYAVMLTIKRQRAAMTETFPRCTDHRIEVFDLEGHFLEERPANVLTMTGSANGERLYASDGNRVMIMDAKTGKQLEIADGVSGYEIAVDSVGDIYGTDIGVPTELSMFGQILDPVKMTWVGGNGSVRKWTRSTGR
jgi:DNA-binding beta-propeller fold protein YncE